MKLLFSLLIFFSTSVNANEKQEYIPNVDIKPIVFSLSMVMMHDVVNPPAAARYYAYCMAGAYEIVSQNNTDIKPLNSFIKNYPTIKINQLKNKYDYKIAAQLCILETGKLMLPSGFILQDYETKWIRRLRKNKISQKKIDNALSVGKEVALQIVAWANTDNYFKLSAKLRYTPLKGQEFWYPTPPAYIEAVEPNWKTIRTIILDSANQFIPLPPVVFSKDTSSKFYKLAMEVYQTSSVSVEKNQDTIAAFWDCNPFAIETSGHMSIGFKKISPGGHWMNITGIACEKANFNIDKSIIAHTFVGITLMDAFISCWDEKYRSNRIRPETYINRYIDAKWQPLLQTPPFPEYTSGHSVVSFAAATMLTHIFGDNFSYTDDTELMFQLAPRRFHSFLEAASEAAISRLYGGIHFRDAIDNGVNQGKNVGKFIINKVGLVNF